MSTAHCARCLQFTSPLRPHDCPCGEDRRRQARHHAATALVLLAAAFGLLYVANVPEPAPRTVSDAVPGQSGAPLSEAGTPAATAGALTPPRSPDAGLPGVSPVAAQPSVGAPTSMPALPSTDAVLLAGGTTRQGVIAYADPSFGPTYLATPEPRGTWIVICGVRACTDPVQTNDVGPELWLQGRGRIADVSSLVFQAICGELRFGLCPGSYSVVERPRVTIPPTDEESQP